jgi:hypothetical protein
MCSYLGIVLLVESLRTHASFSCVFIEQQFCAALGKFGVVLEVSESRKVLVRTIITTLYFQTLWTCKEIQ